MPSQTAYKQLTEKARRLLGTDDDDEADRFVDFGVRFHVVRKSDGGVVPAGTNLPALERVREPYCIGGRYDTLTRTFVGPCEHWREWLIGEKQFEILFNPRSRHALLYSAEGAGKTTLMSMWAWVQIISAAMAGLPGSLGATAPTAPRLETFITGVCDLAPISTSHVPIRGAWGTLRRDAQDIQTVTGHSIQFKSTKRQSEAQGAPLQGYNFGLGIGMDELQDSLDAVADAIARLRSAPDAPIMATATAKDSSAWRTFRDSLSEDWSIHRLSYLDTPFVHDSHWSMMQRNLTKREWQRRGLALDVGPERMVYTGWEREHNLAPYPVRAKDVTREVLARHGRNFEILIGHDPGSLQDYSIFLKAFRLPGHADHFWYVVDEYRTQSTTSDEHAAGLLKHLREKWGVQQPGELEPRALLRCDPYGTTDQKTDRSVYLTFKKYGFDIRSAAYTSKGKGNGVVPKEAGIEMVNSLICNARNERRLFVVRDERNRPATPLLVEALELSERDELGRAEMHRKQSKGGKCGDLSDPPAALRYALWQEERVRLSTGLRSAGGMV